MTHRNSSNSPPAGADEFDSSGNQLPLPAPYGRTDRQNEALAASAKWLFDRFKRSNVETISLTRDDYTILVLIPLAVQPNAPGTSRADIRDYLRMTGSEADQIPLNRIQEITRQLEKLSLIQLCEVRRIGFFGRPPELFRITNKGIRIIEIEQVRFETLETQVLPTPPPLFKKETLQ